MGIRLDSPAGPAGRPVRKGVCPGHRVCARSRPAVRHGRAPYRASHARRGTRRRGRGSQPDFHRHCESNPISGGQADLFGFGKKKLEHGSRSAGRFAEEKGVQEDQGGDSGPSLRAGGRRGPDSEFVPEPWHSCD